MAVMIRREAPEGIEVHWIGSDEDFEHFFEYTGGYENGMNIIKTLLNNPDITLITDDNGLFTKFSLANPQWAIDVYKKLKDFG